MSSTLPSLAPGCCVPDCEDPVSVAVPGPAGDDGAVGDDGAAGAAAYTTFTAVFTMPLDDGASSAIATLANTSWMAVNQNVYASKADGTVMGTFQVTAISDLTHATLKNLANSATGVYASNSAPGQIFTIGSMLVPSGYQGPTGTASGQAAGGDLKGTYLNPKIGIGNTKGSILAGNGTDTVAVPAGTNGHMLAYDSTDAEGVKSLAALPLTGDANIAENRVPRLSAATGLPIPLESSQAQINPPGSVAAGLIGAIVLDASAGNARGTDAVDLQVNRAGAAQVASGTRSFVGAGEKNSALSTESVVVGGDTNTAGVAGVANQAAVVGGHDNSATGEASFVGGGDTNVASAQESVVVGGNGNTASQTQAAVVGGDTNTASGAESFVGAGGSNVASGVDSVVCGGDTNGATGPYTHVGGGKNALADKHGQKAWSAGGFSAVPGSSQAFSLIWRLITLNTAPNKPLFLDEATLLATIGTSRTWAFDILVIGRSAAGVGAAWQIKGAIQNNAGTTALVAAVTTTVIADGTGATWGVAGNVVAEADNANDALNIRVAATVDPAVTVRWTAEARVVEIIH